MTDECIVMFKSTLEYSVKGKLTPKQFAELIKLIYSTRWEDKVINDEDIKDEKVCLIWQTLKHSVVKSKNNSKNYQKKKNANKTVTSDNTPKVDNQPIQDNYVFKPPYKNLQDYEKNILDAINKTDVKEESISERINSINK